jgi:hypothetical protein
MRSLANCILVACGIGGIGWAARCTTVASPAVLREYANYVAAAEQTMSSRFDSGELAWLPEHESKPAAERLASGHLVRWNISDAAVNRRLAAQNGTVIHWIGAIRIPGATVAELRSVLEDYDGYPRIFQPMIFDCKAVRTEDAGQPAYDVVLGLHSAYRFASLFPQHYAFRLKGRMDDSPGAALPAAAGLRVHLKASEIRESDSGVPGRTDFLEQYRDHGIMWDLNAYWRARQQGRDVYLEFESITLARSVEEFACKIGFIPVPKSVVASAMDSLPADSVTVVLEGAKAECERKALRNQSGQ